MLEGHVDDGNAISKPMTWAGLLLVVFENMHKDGKLKVMNSQTGGWEIYGC